MGISYQAIQPQPLSDSNTMTASNPNINIFRPLNTHPNFATNNNFTINNKNNNNVHSETQEAQFVKTQFNKILSKFFFIFNIFVRLLFEFIKNNETI